MENSEEIENMETNGVPDEEDTFEEFFNDSKEDDADDLNEDEGDYSEEDDAEDLFRQNPLRAIFTRQAEIMEILSNGN